ncbi:MAG: hypothetical protein HYV93_25390 [Candidatus Rokubacteria bacterium]|nr:hypothetical protein [Candidatus Rokubacteria bacterium]
MKAPAVRALGLVSGWGNGIEAIPADARAAAAGRALVGLGRPAIGGERFRRATRECLWALAVMERMLEDGRAGREAIAGEGTALLFVTAAAYAASNRAFIQGGGGTHFAYTAPAVVPAEVAIEFGLRGPSAIFIGGPPATLSAIWQAAALLERRACERAIVLAVEIFEECADLHARGRRWLGRPLVEAAAGLWLEPGQGRLNLEGGRVAGRRQGRHGGGLGLGGRLGETITCEPLAAVGLWRRGGGAGTLVLDGAWQGETAHLTWEKGTG